MTKLSNRLLHILGRTAIKIKFLFLCKIVQEQMEQRKEVANFQGLPCSGRWQYPTTPDQGSERISGNYGLHLGSRVQV